MSDIPKIIHVAWKNKNILDVQSPLIVNGIRRLTSMNPDWQLIVYTDEEIDDFLKEALDQDDYKLIENKHIVEKTDIWRLIKLYREGGLYLDIDRFCNVKLSDLATENVRWVLPTNMDFDLSHDFMMTAPKNPVFLTAIRLYLLRRKQGIDSSYFLGPQTYLHVVSMAICGEVINTNPSKEKFDMFRAKIEQIPFIKTYRETAPYDTIIYRHNEADEKLDLETLKRQLYASENIRHWTNEW